MIFCHNHPSGDPAPSRADIELTARLREVGELCGIAVLDHVVVGYEGYTSLSERGWRWRPSPAGLSPELSGSLAGCVEVRARRLCPVDRYG